MTKYKIYFIEPHLSYKQLTKNIENSKCILLKSRLVLFNKLSSKNNYTQYRYLPIKFLLMLGIP